MSAANVALVRYWRCVGPVMPSQGVKPSPVYLPMAQILPEARSVREESGVAVAVSTPSPSS